jgi:hypothetical protein
MVSNWTRRLVSQRLSALGRLLLLAACRF